MYSIILFLDYWSSSKLTLSNITDMFCPVEIAYEITPSLWFDDSTRLRSRKQDITPPYCATVQGTGKVVKSENQICKNLFPQNAKQISAFHNIKLPLKISCHTVNDLVVYVRIMNNFESNRILCNKIYFWWEDRFVWKRCI